MEKNETKTFVKRIFGVSTVLLIAKLIGLVRQMVLASTFGASIETDLISLAEGLISNADYLIVASISTAFIPIYIKIKSEDKRKNFVNNIVLLYILIALLINLILIIGAPAFSKLIAPSYKKVISARLSNYIRIYACSIGLSLMIAIFSALQKSKNHFWQPELCRIIQSLVTIIMVIVLGKIWGINIVVIAMYAGYLFSFIWLLRLSRDDWKFKIKRPEVNAEVKQLIKLMIPLLLGHSLIFVSQIIDKMIVSGLADGAVTAMGYASNISDLVATLVGSLCMVLFTKVTEYIVERRYHDVASMTSESLIQVITVLIYVSVIVACNSNEIITIFFGRGKFDQSAISLASKALLGYSFMFVPYAVKEIYNKVLYGYGDSKSPMINNSIGIVFNIVFSIILSFKFGIFGVALGTSISVFVVAVLNGLIVRGRNSEIKARLFLKNLFCWIIGGIGCVVISTYGKRFLVSYNCIIQLCFITLVTGVFYLIITYRIFKPIFRKTFSI